MNIGDTVRIAATNRTKDDKTAGLTGTVVELGADLPQGDKIVFVSLPDGTKQRMTASALERVTSVLIGQ